MTAITSDLVQVSANPAPTAGQRIQRGAGQAGGALLGLDLVMAFGWFGSGSWTDRQVLAVTAVTIFLVGAAQNVWNWWTHERQLRRPVEAVTVGAVPGPAPSRSKRGDAGQSTLYIVIVVLLVLLILRLTHLI